MTSSALVPVTANELAAIDPGDRDAAVTRYLATARNQLAAAVQMSGPEAVAAVKAQIATAAEATKQLGLSREIQQDAQEMVRRAEYALGKAIRAGQEAGEIRHRGQVVNQYNRWNGEVADCDNSMLASPTDFAPRHELSGEGGKGNGIYAMVDDVSEEQFEEALSAARDEGNVTRANVVRKVQGVKSDRLTTTQKIDRIRELAAKGWTSQQIGKDVGNGEDWIRRLASENSIDIPADKVMRGTRRLNHTRFVTETVSGLEAFVAGLDLLDPAQVDWSDHANWVTSLTDSMRALNRFVNTVRKGPND